MSRDRAIALAQRAGARTATPTRLEGGDTSSVWRLGSVVVKTGSAPASMWSAEAQALRTLGRHGVVVPEVLHVAADGIVLSWVDEAPRDDEGLGRAIATMHAVSGERFGEESTTWIGAVPFEPGTAHDPRHWLVELRLRPLTERTRPLLGDALADTLLESVLTVELPDQGPGLVHGDLWHGNVLDGPHGPVLIDPSCSWGHRGLDLAMMDLFGGFSPRVHAAMEEILPVPSTLRAALPAFRLIPLLVHVAMFGSGYVRGVRQALAELHRRA